MSIKRREELISKANALENEVQRLRLQADAIIKNCQHNFRVEYMPIVEKGRYIEATVQGMVE
jgi:hypothetical protein